MNSDPSGPASINPQEKAKVIMDPRNQRNKISKPAMYRVQYCIVQY